VVLCRSEEAAAAALAWCSMDGISRPDAAPTDAAVDERDTL